MPDTGWAGFVEHANDPRAYAALARLAALHNLRLNTIVSRQLGDVLEIWGAINRETPLRGRRWLLVHLSRARAPDLERIRRLGAVVTTNPISYLYRSGAEVLDASGQGGDWLPHRDLLRARIPFALATDNKPPDPFLALWSVVAREDRSRAVIGPSQRLTPLQALGALTRGGAYVIGRERELGSLTPGKLADLAVLSDDPLAVPLSELRRLRVRLTMVGGRPVHQDDPPKGAEP